MLRLIMKFTREVEKQSEGIPGHDGLLPQIRPSQDQFRVAIRRTAPCFVPQFSKGPVREEPIDGAVEESDAGSVESLVSGGEPNIRPPFLIGEEICDEIGLDNGKEIFIDDVLETAEWCVPLNTRCPFHSEQTLY